MMDVIHYEPLSVSLILLLLLSFVLPIAAARANNEDATQLAWGGQLVAAFAGIAMLLFPQFSYVALACACLSVIVFVYVLNQLPTNTAKARQEPG